MNRPMDIAYQFIKERILDGTYKPSQKLNEIDLSKDIGVSRNTIKKALLKLQQEHLVDIEENKGANVKSYSLDEVLNYMEVREVLEGLVARRAVAHLTEPDLKELEKIVGQMKGHLENNRYDEYSSLNKVFHSIIYKASENKQAVEMINVIKTQLLRYQLRTILIPGRNQESLTEHQNILKALKERNEELADKAVRLHIFNIRKTIQTHYAYLS
ncbi:GntR family transcriptional regulator [Neobacillus sp. Marseille-QA0830]